MDKAEVSERNSWVETSLENFERRVKGLPRESYPELRCISCERPVHDSGLVTPNVEYSPRFVHSTPTPIGEFCPLSSKSGRFGGLSGNDKTASTEIAAFRRNQFMQFNNLCRAWIVCRSFRGGKGKLDQESFIRFVRIADSFGIWSYSYLPEWGIPILLMLMDNHPTPNGNSSFFYCLKKDRNRKGVEWQNLNIKLEAHWVSNGERIIPNNGKNPNFLLEIPFNEYIVKNILDKEDLSWYTQDVLRNIYSFSANELN